MHVHSAFPLIKRGSQLLCFAGLAAAFAVIREPLARHPEPLSAQLLFGGSTNYVLHVWFSAAQLCLNGFGTAASKPAKGNAREQTMAFCSSCHQTFSV